MNILATRAPVLQRAGQVGGRDAEPPFPLFTTTGCTAPESIGVTVTGELDMATAPSLTAEVDIVCLRVSASADSHEFLLDLQDVSFLDSAALLAVHRAHLAATDRGWHVRVAPPTAPGPRHLMMLAMRAGLSLR